MLVHETMASNGKEYSITGSNRRLIDDHEHQFAHTNREEKTSLELNWPQAKKYPAEFSVLVANPRTCRQLSSFEVPLESEQTNSKWL